VDFTGLPALAFFYCNLEDKKCHSEVEWNELVKPYMDD
jgi:hypothetical protein